jgi:hypothetical protein
VRVEDRYEDACCGGRYRKTVEQVRIEFGLFVMYNVPLLRSYGGRDGVVQQKEVLGSRLR